MKKGSLPLKTLPIRTFGKMKVGMRKNAPLCANKKPTQRNRREQKNALTRGRTPQVEDGGPTRGGGWGGRPRAAKRPRATSRGAATTTTTAEEVEIAWPKASHESSYLRPVYLIVLQAATSGGMATVWHQVPGCCPVGDEHRLGLGERVEGNNSLNRAFFCLNPLFPIAKSTLLSYRKTPCIFVFSSVNLLRKRKFLLGKGNRDLSGIAPPLKELFKLCTMLRNILKIITLKKH